LHVVDSKSAAYANELVVKNILKDIKDEKPIDQIVAAAERLYDKIFTIFSVEETSGMKSGGRVTNAILKVIDVLKLKPIIRLNIKNEYGGVTRNYQKGIKKMADVALK
jgi:fatty acid-binding protein DegV